MIHRTFRSAPVIGRVQECLVMFRRAIGGEAEAHAKAKSKSVQGQKGGTRNRHHKATEPKTRGDVTKKPKSRGEVIRMGRASLVDDPVCGAAQGKKDFKAELAAAKLKYGPCEVCGKEKDHSLGNCPYKKHIPNPLEVTVLDGRYGIICECCGQPGGHPGRRGWTGRATLKFCSRCMVWGEHWTRDCPCIQPDERDEREKRRKDIRKIGCYRLREEPEEEEFLDLEPGKMRKDEENEYDA